MHNQFITNYDIFWRPTDQGTLIPFLTQNMYYNADEDYYVCPMGQHLEHIGDVKSKSDLGYESTVSRYRAQNCTGCPLKGMCYKGLSDRRTIEANHKNNAYRAEAKRLLTSGSNAVSSCLSEASRCRCGAPHIKKEEADSF